MWVDRAKTCWLIASLMLMAGASACGGDGTAPGLARVDVRGLTEGVVCTSQAAGPSGVPGTLVLGRAFFFGENDEHWRQGVEMQSSQWGDGRRFAKFGVAVRGPSDIRIEVADDDRDNVVINGWAPDGVEREVRIRTLRVPAPTTCDDPWRFFPGGLLFTRSACARLSVTDGMGAATLRFGLGEDCPNK